jgi:hypothetical protein
MKKILSIFVIAASLVACSSTPAPVAREISFKDKPPIPLYVSSIDVDSSYKPPMTAPNVDHLMTPTPSQAIRTWTKDRLVAKGGSLSARVTIRDASVVETALETSKGWTGWFTSEPAYRYDGKMDVTIELVRPDGTVEAYVSAKTDRTRNVMEDTSIEAKEQIWYDMTERMALDVDAELEKQIKANFSPILTPPVS